MNFDEMAVPLGAVAIMGVAVWSGGGESASSLLRSGSEIKAMRDAMVKENILSKTTQEGLSQRDELAKQRFQNGCTIHVEKATQQVPEHEAAGAVTVSFLPVTEGKIHYEWLSAQPYSPGVVLCDWNGNTGVVGSDGRLTDVAYTGDRALVQQYIDSYF